MALTQSNPSGPRRDRKGETFWARAPYNFIPLPERMVAAREDLPDHDSYGETLLTGRIECGVETCSPVYIRGMLTPDEFREFGEKGPDQLSTEEKERRAPFYAADKTQVEGRERPAIPGSSLRGMVRNLIEIIGFGRMRWVGKEPTFTYRAVAAPREDPLRDPYRQVIGDFGRNVRAGYLVQRGKDWFVQPAISPSQKGWTGNEAYLKVKESTIKGQDLPQYIRLDDPSYRPQIHPVKFDIDQRHSQRGSYTAVRQLSAPERSRLPHEGFLVCSGNMKEASKDSRDQRSPRKSHALVLLPDEKARTLTVRPQAIEDYKAGLTPYQREMLTDWSGDRCADMGCLGDLKPIFYVAKGSEVVYFGHSPNFRIPAQLAGEDRAATPPDFVPAVLRNDPRPDLADAIFGWVDDDEALTQQRAGRVFFEDARFVGSSNGVWLKKDPITPHTLSGPKPTTFQHYLVQDRKAGHDPDRKETLAHYGTAPSETQIRGHKLYWHRGAAPDIEASPKEREHERQLTRIVPVNAGVRFSFTLHFENLRPEELGALWWALSLPGEAGKTYRHKLGMGKPLGMGAVALTPQLILSERRGQEGRYGQLFDEDGWRLAEQPVDGATYARQFESFVLEAAGLPGAGRLADVQRIQMLLAMLEWRDGSDDWLRATSYMEIEAGTRKLNEYKERPVLPDPLAVVQQSATRRTPGATQRDPASRPAPATQAQPAPAAVDATVKTGTVVRWYDDRAFGFIKLDGDGSDVFVHISDVTGKVSLQVGQRVSFKLESGSRGQQARQVRTQ